MIRETLFNILKLGEKKSGRYHRISYQSSSHQNNEHFSDYTWTELAPGASSGGGTLYFPKFLF